LYTATDADGEEAIFNKIKEEGNSFIEVMVLVWMI
jgi:hypothetical protein